jgi:hypothetical protein
MVKDTPEGLYRKLHEELKGKGVASIEQALSEMRLQPLHHSLRELINPGQWRWLIQHRECAAEGAFSEQRQAILAEIRQKAAAFTQTAEHFLSKPLAAERIQADLTCACQVLLSPQTYFVPNAAVEKLCQGDSYTWCTMLGWTFLAFLARLEEDDPLKAFRLSWEWLKEWKLEKLLEDVFQGMMLTETEAQRALLAVQLLLKHPLPLTNPANFSEAELLAFWFSDGAFRQFIGVNPYQGIDWFIKEAFEEWLDLLLISGTVTDHCFYKENDLAQVLSLTEQFINSLKQKAQLSKYQVRAFLHMCGV